MSVVNRKKIRDLRAASPNCPIIAVVLFAAVAVALLLVPAQSLRVLVLFKDDSGWFQDNMPPAEKECPGVAKSARGLAIHIVMNETTFYSVVNASCSELFNLGGNGTYTVYTTLSPKMYDLDIQEDSVISVDSQGGVRILPARLLPVDFCGDRICLKDETCQIDCRIPPAPTYGNGLCEEGEYCGNCTEDCGCAIDEYCKDNTTCMKLETVSECGNGECETDETPQKCAMDCQKTVAFVVLGDTNFTQYELSLVTNLRKNGFSVSPVGLIPETLRDFNGVVIAGGNETRNASASSLEALTEFAKSGGCVAFVGKGPLVLGNGTGWRLEGIAKELLASGGLMNSTRDRLTFGDDSPFGSGEITMAKAGVGLVNEAIASTNETTTNTSIIATWSDGPIFALNRNLSSGRIMYWSTTEGSKNLESGFIKALKYCTNVSSITHAAEVQTICGDGICSAKDEENCCEDCGCPLTGMKCMEGKCRKECALSEDKVADAVIRLGKARTNLLKAAMKARLELGNETLASRLDAIANNLSIASKEAGNIDFKDCNTAMGSFLSKVLESKADASRIRYELTSIMVRANKETAERTSQ